MKPLDEDHCDGGSPIAPLREAAPNGHMNKRALALCPHRHNHCRVVCVPQNWVIGRSNNGLLFHALDLLLDEEDVEDEAHEEGERTKKRFTQKPNPPSIALLGGVQGFWVREVQASGSHNNH